MTAEQSTFNKYSRPNISCLQNTAPHLLPKTKKFSLLKMAYQQNSEYSDFLKFTNLLFKCHVKQGWDQSVLKVIFESAITNYSRQIKTQSRLLMVQCPDKSSRMPVFHIEFHPRCGGGTTQNGQKYFPPIITKLTRLVDIGLIRMYKV
jgi:hypothetical protein